MASLSVYGGGKRRLQFFDGDGIRKTVYLGRAPLKIAETVRSRVEAILEARAHGVSLQPETAAWVAELPDRLAGKLADVGLIPARGRKGAATLGAFLSQYIKSRVDAKRSTVITLQQVRADLVEHFGEARAVSTITPGDADGWRLFLIGKGLADNTVRRRTSRAKHFFRQAVRHRLVRENPFEEIRGTAVRANRARDHFVTRQEAASVIDAAPDAQWRLIIALSRYGGLRCPSEHLALRLADVDFAAGKMTVRSPKTEHRPGKEFRVLPIFPELRPYLEDVCELAEPGTEFVITRYRNGNANLRTQFLKIIARAKLKPWEKLFHNLRLSRQTELAAEFPLHVVCEWLGNSKLVAQEHYLRVTDADFEAATSGIASLKVAQNVPQKGVKSRRSKAQGEQPKHEKTPENAVFAANSGVGRMVATGLEPVTSTMSTWRSNQLS